MEIREFDFQVKLSFVALHGKVSGLDKLVYIAEEMLAQLSFTVQERHDYILALVQYFGGGPMVCPFERRPFVITEYVEEK